MSNPTVRPHLPHISANIHRFSDFRKALIVAMELNRITSSLLGVSISGISLNARIHAPLNDDEDAEVSQHYDIERAALDVKIVYLNATTITPVQASTTLSKSCSGSISANRCGGRLLSLFSAELRLRFPLVLTFCFTLQQPQF